MIFSPRRSVAAAELYDTGYFDAHSYHHAIERRAEARWRLSFVLEVAPSVEHLFELGAADGEFLAQVTAQGITGAGVEPSEEMAANARRAGRDVRVGTAETIDLSPESIDVLCGWHVLEHLANPLLVLRRLVGSLRTTGIAAFEVPNYASAARRAQGASWPHLDVQYHVTQFTPGSVRALMEAAGLRVLRLESISPMLLWRRRARWNPIRWRQISAYRRDYGAHPLRADPWRHEFLWIAAERPER